MSLFPPSPVVTNLGFFQKERFKCNQQRLDFAKRWRHITPRQGRSQTFSFGGPLEGPVLQQGELSMVCVGLSERDLLQWHDVTRKIWRGPLGGQAKFGGVSGPPLAPPSSAPAPRQSKFYKAPNASFPNREISSSDEHWIGLDSENNQFFWFGSDADCKSLQTLGSGPDSDWVNGNEMRHVCYEKAAVFKIFGLHLDLNFTFENIMDCG